MNSEAPLLSALLSVDYRNKPCVLKNLRLEIQRGEIVGLVGESGSGKSTLALALLQLLELKGAKVCGEVIFQGENLFLRSLTLPDDEEFLRSRPSQLSVGQGQRVIIAMAILHRPALLIADEPTSALDTITQSEILSLFARLNRELDMAILYISHDLLSVAALCHRVAILRDGEIVECDAPDAIFDSPRHPYTKRLIAALPGRHLPKTIYDLSNRSMEELPALNK